MPSKKSQVIVYRLDKLARSSGVQRMQFPWTKAAARARRKTKNLNKDLSAEQRQKLKAAREEKKKNLQDALLEARETIWKLALDLELLFGGHKADYYFRLILQTALTIKRPARKLTLWNGFVSKELTAMNADSEDGAAKRVHDDVIKELSARWQAMTAEEQHEAAAEELARLVQRQESRVKGVHNVALHAFNDTRANLESVTRQLKELKGRTNNDFFLLSIRSEINDFLPPYVFHTNERLQHFIEMVTKMPITDFAAKSEGYVISGVDSVTCTAREETIELKRKVKEVIFACLQDTCTRSSITKMFYVNFEEHITLKYGVVVENWPLKRFAAPGALSRVELEVLLNAWKNKTTSFRQLTDDKWTDWTNAYRSGRATVFFPSAAAAITAPTSSSLADTASSSSATDAATSMPAATSSVPSPTSSVPSPTSSDAAPAPAPAPTPATAPAPTTAPALATAPAPAPLAITFVNAVTANDGSGLVVPKRPRKQRSDAGTGKEKAQKKRRLVM